MRDHGEHDGARWTGYGGGPAVVWLHGYTLDSSAWQPLWDLLPGWRHVGLDLPGHGQSRPLRRGETLADIAGLVATCLRESGARRLVGMSYGGMAALETAISYPKALDRLVLAAPVLGGGPVDPDAQSCNLELMRLARERGQGPWLTDRWMSVPPAIFAGTMTRPSLRSTLRRLVEAHSWRELTEGTMVEVSSTDQPARRLELIDARTLLIVGEDDMAAFKRGAEIIRRAVGDCRRVYLTDCGHMPLLEEPGTAAPLLADFLRDD